MIWRIFGAVVVVGGLYLAYGSFIQDGDTLPDGAALIQVSVPDFEAGEVRGKDAFETKCAVCHGKNAAGQQGVAPPLVHKIYQPSHHGDMAFVLAAKQGVRQHHWSFGDMPPIPGVTDGQMANIIAYVRKLQRANGIN